MLHEYRDEISVLKQENAHFAKIFDEHNALDKHIQDISEGREYATDTQLAELKTRKLSLKAEALAMIMDYKESKK